MLIDKKFKSFGVGGGIFSSLDNKVMNLDVLIEAELDKQLRIGFGLKDRVIFLNQSIFGRKILFEV